MISGRFITVCCVTTSTGYEGCCTKGIKQRTDAASERYMRVCAYVAVHARMWWYILLCLGKVVNRDREWVLTGVKNVLDLGSTWACIYLWVTTGCRNLPPLLGVE
jgi:hypothetical protein